MLLFSDELGFFHFHVKAASLTRSESDQVAYWES